MKESSLSPAGPAVSPADFLLLAWQGCRDVAVDVTVVHPLQVAQLPWTPDKAASFLKTTEGKKVAKYATVCEAEGWGFCPAAFDTWGGVGPQAKTILAKLLARSVCQAPAELQAARRAEHRQHLSLSLMRQVWHLLSKRNRALPVGEVPTVLTSGALYPAGRPTGIVGMGPAPVPAIAHVEEMDVDTGNSD